MKYALLYESADDVLAKARPHIAAHGARLAEFRRRGTLLMGGVFANPQAGLFWFAPAQSHDDTLGRRCNVR